MALGEEVGDAYISVHADTGPFRREVKALRKEFGREMSAMAKDTKDLNNEMGDLEKTTKKTGKTVDKDYNRRMREAAKRTVVVRQRSGDLRTEFTKLATAAKKMGDNDFAGKMEGRLTKLREVTQEYDRDVAGLSKDTDEWRQKNIKLQRSLDGLTMSLGHDKKAMDAKRKSWEEMSVIQERALRENKEFEAASRKSRTATDKHQRSVTSWGRAMSGANRKGNIFTRTIKRMTTRMSGSFRRMDGTVKLVIGLIAIAGNMVAALGSGMSAGFVAVAAAAGAAAAALSPLIGVVLPLAYGFVLLKKSFTDKHGNFTLEKVAKWAPEAADGLKNLANSVKKIDASALFQHWNKSLAEFSNTLADSLEFDALAAGIGDAFSEITDSLTRVLKGDAWGPFMAAMEGPLTTALGNFGKALEPILTGFLKFITASAPFAQEMSEKFLDWATAAEKAFSASIDDGSFATFMRTAQTALTSVLDLIGSVGDAIGIVFGAGALTGVSIIDKITAFIDEFNTWAQTGPGENALAQWFADGEKIMDAVFKLLGDVGVAIGQLVTPEVIDQLVGFLDSVGGIVDLLGDLISIVGKANILDVLTAALDGVAKVVGPLVEPLTEFLQALSSEALSLIEDAGPMFDDIGTALGNLLDAITPLLPSIKTFIENGLKVIVPIGEKVVGVITSIIEALTPFFKKILESEATIKVVLGILTAFLAWKAISGTISGVAGTISGFAKGVQGFKDNISVIKTGASKIKSAFGTAKTAIGLGALKIKEFNKAAGDGGFLQFGRDVDTNAAKTSKFSGVLTKMKTGLSAAGGKMKSMGTAVADTTRKIALGTAAVLKNVGAWIAQKAALVASKIAMVAQKVATATATAVQWLMNAALTANPIGIIVVAITAVVAALVLFFTKTELGKKIWQGFMDALVIVWDWLKGAFDWLADIAGSIWEGIGDAWDAGVQMVKDLLTKLWDFIKEVFGWTPLGLIIENWDAIVGFFSTMWTNIASAFTTGIDTVLGFLEGIFNWFAGLWDTISTFISTVWTNISAAFSAGVDAVLGFLAGIWDWYVNLSTTIAGYVTTAWEAIKSAFQAGIDWVLEKLAGIWKWYTDLRDKVGAVIAAVWENIKGKFSAGITAVLESLGKIWKWYTDLRDKVGAVIQSAWTTVKQKFTDGVDAVMKKLADIWDWFKKLPNDIKGFFSNIASTISQPFKNAFNSVADAWNNTVGKLSWTVPSWVPGIGGNKISAPKVPHWYAAGGIATTPTIAGFGEAGAEALVPLNRPLNQVDPSVRDLSAFAQGKGSGMTIAEGAIVVHTPATNGRVVAESVLDRLVSYSR